MKLNLRILVYLAASIISSQTFAFENHSDEYCGKKVQIKSLLKNQHIALDGNTFDLTSSTNRRVTFTIECNFGDKQFTFSRKDGNKTRYMYAKSETEILNDRSYPGNSGKWYLNKLSNNTYAIISRKFSNQYLSVDGGENFSLESTSNSGVLDNEKYSFTFIDGSSNDPEPSDEPNPQSDPSGKQLQIKIDGSWKYAYCDGNNIPKVSNSVKGNWTFGSRLLKYKGSNKSILYCDEMKVDKCVCNSRGNRVHGVDGPPGSSLNKPNGAPFFTDIARGTCFSIDNNKRIVTIKSKKHDYGHCPSWRVR